MGRLMFVVGIVQARMTSTRLPGKVLADINGQPMLAYMLKRVLRAHRLHSVWVATTINAEDDPVVTLCETLGLPVFRGDEMDVLGRYALTAAKAKAEIVVRLTADCPLIDPNLIDQAIDLFESGGFDYLSNAIELSYPDGLDVEVFTRAALEEANKEAMLPFHREHVTPYLRTGVYADVPTGDFRVGYMRAPADFSHLRWTVDTPNDLECVRAIVKNMPSKYGWMDVLSLITRQPKICQDSLDFGSLIKLRPAVMSDAEILLDWANRPESMANRLASSGKILLQDHLNWFRKKLLDPGCAIWICEGPEGPVGQVRLEMRSVGLEVSIFISPSFRKKNVGVSVLEMIKCRAAQRWPGVPLIARVKPDNWASRRLFSKAGFGGMIVHPDHLMFSLVTSGER